MRTQNNSVWNGRQFRQAGQEQSARKVARNKSRNETKWNDCSIYTFAVYQAFLCYNASTPFMPVLPNDHHSKKMAADSPLDCPLLPYTGNAGILLVFPRPTRWGRTSGTKRAA
jgi:hypothetical protein